MTRVMASMAWHVLEKSEFTCQELQLECLDETYAATRYISTSTSALTTTSQFALCRFRSFHHPDLPSLSAVMATSTPLDPFLRGSTSKKTRALLRVIILFTIAAAAVSARLFSVIRTYKDHHQLLQNTNPQIQDSRV